MLQNIVHGIMKHAESINAYGIFSILLFFGFFTGMLVWAFRLKKNYLRHMGGLPLNSGEKTSNHDSQSE